MSDSNTARNSDDSPGGRGFERRTARRKGGLRPALMVADFGNRAGLIEDISETGIRVGGIDPAAIRASQHCRFDLPQRFKKHTRIESKCEVAWIDPSGQAGIRLVELPPMARQHLREWVNTEEGWNFQKERHPATHASSPVTHLKQCITDLPSAGGEPAGGGQEGFKDFGTLINAMAASTLGTLDAQGVPQAHSRVRPTPEGQSTTPMTPMEDVALLKKEILETNIGLGHAMNAAVERMLSLTGAQGAAVALQDGNAVNCMASRGLAPKPGVRFLTDSGLLGECFQTGRIVRCDDAFNDPRVEAATWQRRQLRSILLVPIHGESSTIGIVEVLAAAPRAFDYFHVLTCRLVAEMIAELVTRAAMMKPMLVEGKVAGAPASPSQQAGMSGQASAAQPSTPQVAAEEEISYTALRNVLLNPAGAGTGGQADISANESESVPQTVAESAAMLAESHFTPGVSVASIARANEGADAGGLNSFLSAGAEISEPSPQATPWLIGSQQSTPQQTIRREIIPQGIIPQEIIPEEISAQEISAQQKMQRAAEESCARQDAARQASAHEIVEATEHLFEGQVVAGDELVNDVFPRANPLPTTVGPAGELSPLTRRLLAPVRPHMLDRWRKQRPSKPEYAGLLVAATALVAISLIAWQVRQQPLQNNLTQTGPVSATPSLPLPGKSGSDAAAAPPAVALPGAALVEMGAQKILDHTAVVKDNNAIGTSNKQNAGSKNQARSGARGASLMADVPRPPGQSPPPQIEGPIQPEDSASQGADEADSADNSNASGPRAQVNMGNKYRDGNHVERNYQEAARWYRAAAEQGDAVGQNHLGDLYREGKGVPQDAMEAVKWYQMAAVGGSVPAQTSLGDMYRDGRGVPRDNAAAMKFYRMAANHGNAGAQDNLGDLLRDGKGAPQNYSEAVRWYFVAAKRGFPTAKLHIADMYRDGLGVPQDYAQAAKWYREAALKGIAAAQINLGDLYRDGNGVPQDHDQAIKWYQMAGDQGMLRAQIELTKLSSGTSPASRPPASSPR